MSDYIVSARKYRPSTFNTVVGQKALVKTLKNAIASGKLAHAYLFCGPRGVGKTTCARIFAITINCENRTGDGEACNQCESCKSFHEQRSYNVYELDAASNNSVDNIRELIDQVQIPPQIGRYKVFIIDEVHMLSTQAFNAFLKTLEEPPKHAIFVMCTTEKQKILPTILSRCQTYDFQRISSQDIADQLAFIAQQENIDVETNALQVIARKADGGMRDALSVFDQITSFTGGHVTYQSVIENLNILDYDLFFRITDAALQNNSPVALLMLDEVIRRGFDPQYFIGGWAGHLRDLMVAQDPATVKLIEAGPEVAQRYKQQAANCHPAFLYNAVLIANDCDFNYRNSRNKRLSVEVAIMRICQLTRPIPVNLQPQQTPMQPVTNMAQPQQQGNATVVVPSQAQSPTVVTQQQPMAAPVAPRNQQTEQPQSARMPIAQSVQRPKTQPVMAQRGVSMPGRTMMASLRTTTPNVSPTNLSQPPVAQQQQTEQVEPVEESALRRAWKQYSETIPEEKLLVNAIQNSEVYLFEDVKIGVKVSNDQQLQRLNEHRGDLLEFLSQRLHNSHLEMTFTIVTQEGGKAAFTPRERLAEIREQSPELIDELVETFGLELS